MNDSILTAIKKMLFIGEEDESFDADIIMHINSYLFVLNQLGVGPTDGFSIHDKSQTWKDFLGDQEGMLEGVKSYLYARVRLVFDPPTASAVLDSLNRIANEFEWRLNVAAETKTTA